MKSNKSCNCSYCINNSEFDMPDEIVEAALSKNLVLFCGAGISTESKLVSSKTFYTNVFNELINKSKLNINPNISFSSLMGLYTKEITNGRKILLSKIKNRFDYINTFPQLLNIATRFHKEVAANPFIETIITTNWDTYFEDYCDCTAIINDEDCTFWNLFNRRVFKIHGSINNIGSIILTNEDYEDSYQKFTDNLIGDRLKTILTSNTIVFIGFSFGDEDLNRLIDVLSVKMGNFINQFYVVTIDNKWNDIVDKRIVPIITDGTYFIHQLNNLLIKKGKLLPKKIYDNAEDILNKIKLQHNQIINSTDYFNEITEYPELLLSIAFQDGLIHALEHCISNRKKGDYLKPDYLKNEINKLKKYYEISLSKEKYDLEYFNFGYIKALEILYLNTHLNKLEQVDLFVFGEKQFSKKEDLFNYILKYRNENQLQYCSNIVESLNNTVINYVPWLIWDDINF